MELPRFIGICGKRRSGKDTVANILCDMYGFRNEKIANNLKLAIKVLFGFSDEQLETDIKDEFDKHWGITPRKAMQFVGTEVMQFQIQEILPHIGRTFWIKSFINKHIDNKESIVISDLRFIHEYEELKKHNILVIRIDKNLEHIPEHDNHISENEYLHIPADIIVKNDGTIAELQQALKDALYKKRFVMKIQ